MFGKLQRWLTGTLRRRLTFGMGLAVTLMMTLFIHDMTRREEALIMGQQSEQAAALAQSVAKSSGVWLASRDYAGLQEIVDGLAGYPDLRHAIVLDPAGQVLAHNDKTRRGLYLTDLPTEAKPQVLQRTRRLVDTVSPVILGDRPIGWVRIGLAGDALAAEIASVRRNGIYYALFAIALSTVFATLTGRYLTRRLNIIQRVADAVQAGQSELRAQVPGDDEAARLARQFNQMLDSLANQQIALQESEKLFRAITDTSPLAIYMSSGIEQRARYINSTFTRLFGYTIDEVPSITEWWTLAFPDAAYRNQVAEEWQRRVAYAIETHSAINPMDVQVTCKDGSKKNISWGFVSIGHQNWAFGLDFTEREHAETELKRHRDHLEALVQERTAALSIAKNAAEVASVAKSAFLANMSHEMRTPLHAIMGMVDLIRKSGVTPEQANWLDRLGAAERHLLEIINNVLDLSKIEAGKLVFEDAHVNVASIVDNVVSMLSEPAHAKNLQLAVEAEAVPENLMGDPTRLKQALLNYANNAIKFTENGTITLRVRTEENSDDGALVRFEVQDTGAGIAPDMVPKLFSPFEQGDNSPTRRYGGTGLGLAITKRLAQLMDGDSGVVSTPGSGSTFWFTARLRKGRPAIQSSATSSTDSAEAILLRDHRNKKILLVEDDVDNRDITLAQLKPVWKKIDVARDGVEAVELAGRTDYDLILMDMQMPRMDGLEATRRIRKLPNGADIPIIAMTANVFPEDKIRCQEAGMNDFIAKAVSVGAPFGTILKWLARSGH